MTRALCFWARWTLATALLHISAGLAQLARSDGTRTMKMPETPS
jgi:hypothetical protein